MAGLSWMSVLTFVFAVTTSEVTISDECREYCGTFDFDYEVCDVQYIVKATITGKQGPLIDPKFQIDTMDPDTRNFTLETYGFYGYSLDVLEVVMSDAHWSVAHGDYPITGLPLDVDIDVIRCGINLEIGSTYILWGYFNGWLARGDSRRSLGLYECILPVEINASDPVPRRFLDRNC